MRTPKEHLISLYGIFTESDIIILTREYEYEHELEYRPGKAEPTRNLIGSLSGRINKFDDVFNVTFIPALTYVTVFMKLST